MESALRDLARQLLACADPALLDAPLDQSANALTDEAARELLMALHEEGTAHDLREVLQGDTLASWAHERLTMREQELVVRGLRQWLASGTGGDDPTRLAQVDAPPEASDALVAWSERHGVAHLLERPARELLQDARELPPSVRVVDCCRDGYRVQRGASLLAEDTLRDDARRLLVREARRLRARDARAELHRRPVPSGPLGMVARRLRGLCAEHPLEQLDALPFVSARPVTLDEAQARATGALHEGGAVIEVALQLSGFEQRALSATCSRCVEAGCRHVAALAARLYEACIDPSDRLHEPLRVFASVPSWRRFVAALAPSTEPSVGSRGEIVYVVRGEGERLLVGTVLRRESGRSKLASPQSLLRSPFARDYDGAPLAALAAQTRTLAAQYLPLDLATLRALVEHPLVELEATGSALRVVEELAKVALHEQPEGLVPSVTLAGVPLVYREQSERVRYAFQLDPRQGTLSFCAITPPLARLLRALEHFRGVLPEESHAAIAPYFGALTRSAQVALPRALEGLERPPPSRLLLRIAPHADEGIDLSLTVRALPLSPLWPPGRGPALVHGVVDGATASLRRDLTAERLLADELLDRLALRDALSLGPFSFRLDSKQEALAVLTKAARAHELVEIEWAERARPLRVVGTVTRGALKVELFKQGEFCALQGAAHLGDKLVPLERLLDAARNGERFVCIEGGDHAEIERELLDRLERAQLCLMPSARALGITSAAVPALREQLPELGPGDRETERFLEVVASDAVEPLPALALTLRAYQEEGARFLIARSKWAPGACLADEMGLGKTLQTIALLAARAELGPALVVAPTSVAEGWQRELARAAPELRGQLYRGDKRQQLLGALGPGSVLITSYDLVLRDRPHLEGLTLATLVVDEAQWLKNARTRRARAVASLHASFRVVLTGTPVENRLADLWSISQLFAPGLLGGWSPFRARFAVPIERYENRERAAALRALVAPLLLRRTKAEVAHELPPRTEVVHTIELSQAERDLYAAALLHARKALGKRKRVDDTSRTVRILAELTRLRQLACHPRLVVEDTRVSSSKTRALLRLLDDLLPRGHRVLLFSQFVRHLQLVREALERRGERCLYLDGQTPAEERMRVVDAFQRGDAALFLISLKAGGTGLNLTAADYVVHLDPWWNPAAEDQASDRSHRIGQERPVTVVRLVAQGTIEERVLALHEHKRQLARYVLEDGGGAPISSDELEALLVE